MRIARLELYYNLMEVVEENLKLKNQCKIK